MALRPKSFAARNVVPEPMKGSRIVSPGCLLTKCFIRSTGFSFGCRRPMDALVTIQRPFITPSSRLPVHCSPRMKINSYDAFQGNERSPMPDAGPLSQIRVPRVNAGAGTFKLPKHAHSVDAARTQSRKDVSPSFAISVFIHSAVVVAQQWLLA